MPETTGPARTASAIDGSLAGLIGWMLLVLVLGLVVLGGALLVWTALAVARDAAGAEALRLLTIGLATVWCLGFTALVGLTAAEVIRVRPGASAT